MLGRMLTTVDNPFNPFEEFVEWFEWDSLHGYNTSGYLAKVANLPDDASDKYIEKHVDEAIDEIIQLHNGEVYRAVAPEDYE